MIQEDVREVPVLVVGAGPAGLVAAGTLALAGVPVLLVERRRALSGLPRATAISTRSMELLRSWGLEDEIRAGGVDAQLQVWVSETLATARSGSAVPAGLPTREQSAVVSPTAPAVVPQDHLEPVLLRHIRSLPGCEVLVGTQVVRLENQPGAVGAVLRDSATGRTQVVHARYVIGADGAHSLVRSALGIPMRGPEHLAEALTVLFHAPLWDLLGDLRYVLYAVTTPVGPGDFLPAGRGDRWLYAREWNPQSEQLADYTDERLSQFIRLGAGVANLSPRFERIGAFSFAAQIADRFRQGTSSSSGTPRIASPRAAAPG
jgi:putative polyketide hydroxylase